MSAKAAAAASAIALCALCTAPLTADAQAVISEIMYNPDGTDSGHEWLEAFDAGSDPIPLTEWHLSENQTDHRISAVQGGDRLAAGTYAVIADNASLFLADHPGYQGQLFDSSFSLGNDGEPLALLDASGATADAIAYDPSAGADGDGESLTRMSASDSAFAAAAPSPGEGALLAAPGAPGGTGAGATDLDAGMQDEPQPRKATSTPASAFPVTPQLYAYAGGDRTIIVGADVELDGRAFTPEGTQLDPATVRFIWNFGDGGTAEGEAVMHHWSHPGRYAVTLTLAEHKFAAMDEIVVDAEPAALGLSVLPDGSIAIGNESGRELDLSGWLLASGRKMFALPEHTRLLAGAAVPFAPETTGLTLITHPVALEYPDGEIAIREGEEDGVPAGVATSTPSSDLAAPAAKVRPLRVPEGNPLKSASAGSIIGMRIAPPAPAAMQPDAPASVLAPSMTPSGTAPASAEPEAATQLALAADPAEDAPLWPWMLGVGALAGLASVSAIAARRRGAQAWDIIEETSDAM